jgi:4a-hydroxytetrahydrobiopterin dehydratase
MALNAEQVRRALAALPGWSCEHDCLLRRWRFADFGTVMAFMADCVLDIERLDHHPHWENTYDALIVRLTSHDAGNRITAKDVELAKIMQWKAQSLNAIDG